MGKGWGAGPVKPRHRPAHRRRGRHAKGCWLTALAVLVLLPLLMGWAELDGASGPAWRKRGLVRGLLFGLPVSLALWAVVLVPLILWGPL